MQNSDSKPICLASLPGAPASAVLSVLRSHAEVVDEITFDKFDPDVHGNDIAYLYLHDDPNSALQRLLSSQTDPRQRGLAVALRSAFRPWEIAGSNWLATYPRLLSLSRTELVESLLDNSEGEIGFAAHFQSWFRARSSRDITYLHASVWRECLPAILASYGKGKPRYLRKTRVLGKVAGIPKAAGALPAPPRIPRAIRWSGDHKSVQVYSRSPISLSPSSAAGMFSVVNCVTNAAKRFEDGDLPPFRIDSTDFIYGDWNNFFEHPFDVAHSRERMNLSIFGREFLTSRRFLKAEELHAYSGQINEKEVTDIILPPSDRHSAHRIINKYIRLIPDLRAKIDSEIELSGVRDMIGIHARGPGRLDGGTGFMRWKLGYSDVPYAEYFRAVDVALEGEERDIYVFSDASEVIDTFRSRYGRRVHTRSTSFVPKGGEGHLASDTPSKSKLAEDILTECWMMAAARLLVHGNSNVTNFALCLNPQLEATDIYERFYRFPVTPQNCDSFKMNKT